MRAVVRAASLGELLLPLAWRSGAAWEAARTPNSERSEARSTHQELRSPARPAQARRQTRAGPIRALERSRRSQTRRSPGSGGMGNANIQHVQDVMAYWRSLCIGAFGTGAVGRNRGVQRRQRRRAGGARDVGTSAMPAMRRTRMGIWRIRSEGSLTESGAGTPATWIRSSFTSSIWAASATSRSRGRADPTAVRARC